MHQQCVFYDNLPHIVLSALTPEGTSFGSQQRKLVCRLDALIVADHWVVNLRAWPGMGWAGRGQINSQTFFTKLLCVQVATGLGYLKQFGIILFIYL